MAYVLDELSLINLYKGEFYYPINIQNKQTHSVVYLLTPNINSSINILNSKNARYNSKYFKSYFLEKNVEIVLTKIEPLKESMVINEEEEPYNATLSMDIQHGIVNEEFYINEYELFNHGIRCFNGTTIDTLLESNNKYNFSTLFKKILYDNRIKTQKEVILKYDEVRKQVPYIKYTYTNPSLYGGKNIFYDFSYYTESFFRNLPKSYTQDKGLEAYLAFIRNYLNYNPFKVNGYNKETVVISTNEWNKSLDYKEVISPLTLFSRYLRKRVDKLKETFKNKLIMFTNGISFFVLDIDKYTDKNYNRFMRYLKFLVDNNNNESDEIEGDSKKAILLRLADRLEKDGAISLDNITDNDTDIDIKKSEVLDKLELIADKYDNAEDAEEELDNTDDQNLIDVISDLQSDNTGVKMNKARIQRMEESRKKILEQDIEGRKVKDLLKSFKELNTLPESSIPIESIDDHWHHVKFTNFNKIYDIRADIVATFLHFQNVTHPMNVVSIDVKNTSTSEDYKETWTVVYEDAETGKRSNMVLDIPLIIGDRFMRLAGNEKNLIGQLMLLPIVKTDTDTVQIVSNYNKIFIRRKSPSGASKSSPIINKLVKALDKYDGKNMKIVAGDNKKTYKNYTLPIELVDIGSLYYLIEFKKDKSYITFDMSKLASIPFDRSMIPSPYNKLSDEELNNRYVGIYVNPKGLKEPILDSSVDAYILDKIREYDEEDKFKALYTSAAVTKRLMYAEASIMSTTIPIAVILSYTIGLQKMLDVMKVQYSFSETRPSKDTTYIKFNDGYLSYEHTTSQQNMILNGLMECNFDKYSIKDINNKDMWLDILDEYGGRIKADGLDNFYDLMFDPITVEVCHYYNLPDNYIDALIYASGLLIDTSYSRHTDITTNRLRTNEIIVGHLYLVLSKAFGSYRNMIKRSKNKVSFTAKKGAVIDSILNHDQTSSDLSTLTPLLEAEAANKVTFKGLSGMNSDRAFSIDKRIYDKSMTGILGLATGSAGTVGINRQLAIDARVLNKRGILSTGNAKDLDNLSTFTVMEALSPLAVNHDDPVRTCMAFVQTVQHQMIVKRSMPNLITTGCDEALPYLTSNKFAYKFNGKKGIVVDVTDDYIITQDLDTKKCDYIDLRELIQKNSDGGFYVTTKLDSIVKKGDKLHENQIIAYNKSSYSKAIGNKDKLDEISYNIGTLAKIAIMDTDLGYEDSCVVDNTISEALATEFVVQKEVNIDKNTNVYNIVNIGSHVEEGDPLMVFQDVFDEKETNELLASLAKDNDMLSDLGRKQIHSKVTGTIQDIKVYRTCDIESLSPTLQKVCKDYDAKIEKLKKVMDKYRIDKKYTLESTGKLPAEGKLKELNGVRIEFYIKVYDKFGIGDKLVFAQALKGVNSMVIPAGEEAYTDFRPNEHINAFLTIDGVMARMVTSAISMGLVNKALIELARQCQEKLDIKWRPIQTILQDENN